MIRLLHVLAVELVLLFRTLPFRVADPFALKGSGF
jgi:hypothetical protein